MAALTELELPKLSTGAIALKFPSCFTTVQFGLQNNRDIKLSGLKCNLKQERARPWRMAGLGGMGFLVNLQWLLLEIDLTRAAAGALCSLCTPASAPALEEDRLAGPPWPSPLRPPAPTTQIIPCSSEPAAKHTWHTARANNARADGRLSWAGGRGRGRPRHESAVRLRQRPGRRAGGYGGGRGGGSSGGGGGGWSMQRRRRRRRKRRGRRLRCSGPSRRPATPPCRRRCGNVCFGYSDLTLPSLLTAPAAMWTVSGRDTVDRPTHELC